MVKAEARNGRLSARRRKRIIQYAAALQLTPMQASRIVTQGVPGLGAGDSDAAPPPLQSRRAGGQAATVGLFGSSSQLLLSQRSYWVSSCTVYLTCNSLQHINYYETLCYTAKQPLNEPHRLWVPSTQ